MTVITCASCDGQTTYRVRPDRWFECPAGHELAPRDVVVDGMDEWAVDASGVLGTVVHPSFSLEQIAEAHDVLTATGDRTAFDAAAEACRAFLDAYRVGVA
ncbi:hypothetical protein ACIBL6_47495 [Streptomyces sp. NPDC050400]|uniref:hypothetical protein n=1 Tax=Streptomyces sp. NPDC050400 TaxID=3365610 RepID=UPI00379570B7